MLEIKEDVCRGDSTVMVSPGAIPATVTYYNAKISPPENGVITVTLPAPEPGISFVVIQKQHGKDSVPIIDTRPDGEFPFEDFEMFPTEEARLAYRKERAGLPDDLKPDAVFQQIVHEAFPEQEIVICRSAQSGNLGPQDVIWKVKIAGVSFCVDIQENITISMLRERYSLATLADPQPDVVIGGE